MPETEFSSLELEYFWAVSRSIVLAGEERRDKEERISICIGERVGKDENTRNGLIGFYPPTPSMDLKFSPSYLLLSPSYPGQ